MVNGTKVAVGFDKIIQTDRARRKNEALAEDIFSRGRRKSAPGTAVRKPGTGPSLASRVGISKDRSRSLATKPIGSTKFTKRPVAPGNVTSDWTHDLHGINNPSKHSKLGRNARFGKVLNGSVSSPNLNSQFNVLPKTPSGLSIRGNAGPTTVQAQNLAPGTTAEDIESEMGQVGGKILNCTIVGTRPNVIAEIVFGSREGANRVIDKYNNRIADGHLLNLFIKPDAPAPAVAATPTIPLGPRADIERANARSTRNAESGRYNNREDNRARNGNRDAVVDGSYGFEDDRMDTDEYDRPRALYSDNIVGGKRDRDIYRSSGTSSYGRGDNRDGGRGGGSGQGYR